MTTHRKLYCIFKFWSVFICFWLNTNILSSLFFFRQCQIGIQRVLLILVSIFNFGRLFYLYPIKLVRKIVQKMHFEWQRWWWLWRRWWSKRFVYEKLNLPPNCGTCQLNHNYYSHLKVIYLWKFTNCIKEKPTFITVDNKKNQPNEKKIRYDLQRQTWI